MRLLFKLADSTPAHHEDRMIAFADDAMWDVEQHEMGFYPFRSNEWAFGEIEDSPFSGEEWICIPSWVVLEVAEIGA